MNVARVTVMAMSQGLALGRHVSWKVREAAAKNGSFGSGFSGSVLAQSISFGVWLWGVGEADSLREEQEQKERQERPHILQLR